MLRVLHRPCRWRVYSLYAVCCAGPADGEHDSEDEGADEEMGDAEGRQQQQQQAGGGGRRGKRGKFTEEFKAKVLGVLQVRGRLKRHAVCGQQHLLCGKVLGPAWEGRWLGCVWSCGELSAAATARVFGSLA
jgi:hypothetical protein